MDYKSIVRDYLSSDDWSHSLKVFLEFYGHCFDPLPFTEHEGKIYLCTGVCLEINRRLQKTDGRFELQLTEQQFQKYFDPMYSEWHRFAILFAHWWGLPEQPIQDIAAIDHKDRCLRLLHSYLCYPEILFPPIVEGYDNATYPGLHYAVADPLSTDNLVLFDSPPKRCLYYKALYNHCHGGKQSDEVITKLQPYIKLAHQLAHQK